jgi:hypothetical protein
MLWSVHPKFFFTVFPWRIELVRLWSNIPALKGKFPPPQDISCRPLLIKAAILEAKRDTEMFWG